MRKSTFLSVLLILLLVSCKEEQENQQEKENLLKANLNNLVEQCWNNKDMAMLKTLTTENFVRNVNGIKVANNQNEMAAAMNVFFTGFPDLNLTVQDVVVKEGQLFAHWTFTGSNTGIFGETAPTGKKVKVSGYVNAKYNNEGKMDHEDVYFNELGLLQQLGYTLTPPVVE